MDFESPSGTVAGNRAGSAAGAEVRRGPAELRLPEEDEPERRPSVARKAPAGCSRGAMDIPSAWNRILLNRCPRKIRIAIRDLGSFLPSPAAIRKDLDNRVGVPANAAGHGLVGSSSSKAKSPDSHKLGEVRVVPIEGKFRVSKYSKNASPSVCQFLTRVLGFLNFLSISFHL